MTRDEMHAMLVGWGVRSRFIPDWDYESGTIALRTRKAAIYTDGRLHGSRIDADIGRREFTVWTPQIKKANRVSAEKGLRIRHWTGECELTVPAALADAILPTFGAKVRHPRGPMSPERREKLLVALKLGRERVANEADRFPKHSLGGGSGNPKPKKVL